MSKRGSGSGFVVAAKVLFDSAQKVGVVKPLEESNKEYAQQLKKIQSQSKKRGGSLGGVSYKVAEFLATQRTPVAPTKPRPTVNRSIAKKVPLINIPMPPGLRKGVDLSRATPAPDPKPAGKAEPPQSLSMPVAPLIVPPTDSATHEKKKGAASGPAPEAAPPELPLPNVLITEDEPLFRVQDRAPAHITPSVTVARTREEVPQAPAPRRARPVLSVPITSSSASSASIQPKADTPAAAEVLSVSSWEQQREQEMERLQQKQMEAENRRLAVLREQEHRTMGDAWVDKRSQEAPNISKQTEEMKLIHSMYFSDSMEDGVKQFQKLVKAGSRGAPLIPAAVGILTRRAIHSGPMERPAAVESLFELLERSNVAADEVAKARIATSNGDDVLTAYNSLSDSAKTMLSRPLARRVVAAYMQDKKWEDALRVIEQSNAVSTDRSGSLELLALRFSYILEQEDRTEFLGQMTKRMTASGRMGKEARLALARAEKGMNRRTLLQQIAASADADEVVYADLIQYSDRSATQTILSDMEKRGLNPRDPHVLVAVATRAIDEDDPTAIFDVMERQTAQHGFLPNYNVALALAVKVSPTTDVLRRAVDFLKKNPPAHHLRVLRTLLPRMHEAKMTEEIVSLADYYGRFFPLPKTLPNAIAFINDALRSVGREPLSSLGVQDINYTPVAQLDHAGASAESATVDDLLAVSDTMVKYAREKQWLKALEVVESLSSSVPENNSTVTLIYNCSLSAAVDQPDAVRHVYELMQQRGVAMNTTTVNTVQSSLSKAGLWEEAIEFYERTSTTERDVYTYLVQLSLLGRHSMWEEAVTVFDEMRRSISKPSATMYSLAIGATANHSWGATLRIFQDMIKVHGATIKDSVTNQVVRTLEQNDRSADVVKLRSELKKRKKKKKK